MDLFNDPTTPILQAEDASGANWFDKLLGSASNIPTSAYTSLLGGGLGLLGSYLQGSSATDAAEKYAQAQLAASQLAADAAKFRPVGVTSNFGKSNFGYDAAGNLVSAGYTLTPQMKAQQDALMAASNGMLTQFADSKTATAPMGTAAQTAMTLGQGYLGTSPQEQAAKYMAEQQALLEPYRQRDLANLQNTLLQQGRLGLATGGTSTLGAANPEMEAFYNAQRMQDLELAAKATQGGMDYAKFGAGLVGTGGDLLNSMYGTQVGAFAPYQTALGGATNIEGLGQSTMDIGTSLGAKTSSAAANVGQLLGQGMVNSASTMQGVNSYSPWGSLLSGAGNMLSQYSGQQQQQRFDPYIGQALI